MCMCTCARVTTSKMILAGSALTDLNFFRLTVVTIVALVRGVSCDAVPVTQPSLCAQFLPVYNPSEEEKKDPALYASNVRHVMAE